MTDVTRRKRVRSLKGRSSGGVRGGFDSSPLRRAIVAVVALKLAGIILVFDPSGVQAFDLPKSLYSRAGEWVLVGLLALALLRYSLAIVPRTRLHVFVVAYALAALAAAFLAENKYLALYGDRERYLGLTFFADMLVLYLAVGVAFRDLRDWAMLLAVAALAGLLAVGYALAQLLGLDPIDWTPSPRNRPFGTFGHPDMFGQFLGVAFGVSLGVGVAAAEHARALRVCAALAALLAVGVAVFVATRGSVLAIAAAVALLPFVLLRLQRVPARALPRLAAGVLILIVALAAAVSLSPLGARLRATLQGVAVADRLVIYENALRAFADRPLFGWGPDAFAVAYPHYRQARETTLHGVNVTQSSAHDWVLQTAVTTGAAGLAALLVLVGGSACLLWRRLGRKPILAAPLLLGSAAYWAHGLVTVGSISLDWVPWVAFAGAAASEAERLPMPSPGRRIRRVAQALVLIAAVAAALTTIPALRANDEAQRAALALQQRDAPTALAAAGSAVRLDPGRAHYWRLLGVAHDRREQWRDAGDAYAEAVRLAPHIPNYWSLLAQSRMRQALAGDDSSGGRSAALDAAHRGVEVDPNEPSPHAALALVTASFGDFELAFGAATVALSLYQWEPAFDQIAAQIALAAPDPQTSRQFLEGLLRYKDSATLRVGIAQLSLKLGDRDAASRDAKRALELEPANVEAQSLLRSLGD